MRIALLLLAQLAAPDPQWTPGAVTALTQAQVCAVASWREHGRHVTVAMKHEVFRRYGVLWTDRAHYQVDHLIPRSSGGADALENLWIQPLAEAYKKDGRERAIHRSICRQREPLPLVAAQETFRRYPQ